MFRSLPGRKRLGLEGLLGGREIKAGASESWASGLTAELDKAVDTLLRKPAAFNHD